jgi:endonuclease III
LNKKERALHVYAILDKKYPSVSTFLTHNSTFELLIAVILSAQCTDARVNLVTPDLFKRFPKPENLAYADIDSVRDAIKSINFFNNKALNIQKTAKEIHEKYKDVVPDNLVALVGLAGVGRKTANVVLGQAFGIPGITVDTHVKRVSNRLDFTKQSDAVKAEKELMKLWPKDIWSNFSTVLILHGREVCTARNPRCEACIFKTLCPSSYV